MPQCVNGNALLEAGCGDRPAHGILNGAAAHGLGGLVHRLALHGLLAGLIGALIQTPAPAHRREKQLWVPMPLPPAPQDNNHVLGDWHIARLAAFALAHVESSSLGVDVANLDGDGLSEAQSAGIDQRKAGVEAHLGHLAEQGTHFLPGDDHGKGFAMLDEDLLEDAPPRLLLEVIAVVDAKSHLRLVHGGGLVVLLLAEEKEVIPDLGLGKRLGVSLEVLG